MVRFVRRLAGWVVYGIAFFVLSRLRVRFVSLTHPERIGHLCVEPDCFIKEGVLGLRPRYRAVFLLPRRSIANRALADHWARHLTIVTSEFWCRLFGRVAERLGLSYPVAQYTVAIDETARSPAINAQWGHRPPVLALDKAGAARRRAELHRLGLPEGAWFVCVHSREGGYSPADEHLHSFRNSDIDSYRLAMQMIADRGGWCVRVGEKNSKPLSPQKSVIDYAHSGAKSDWMDVYLCADCRFFLGNSSGLYAVANAFGKRSALANMIPVSATLPFGNRDIGIPKLLRWRDSGELLRFPEILASAKANYRFAAQYVADGILVEDNSPDDIRDLALEMLESVEGALHYSASEDASQQRFRELMHPGHYSYGAASRVGRDFLRKYASLLDG